MDDWLMQLEKALIQAADDAERFVNATVDELLVSAEEISDGFETQVDQAFDHLEQVVEPWATSMVSMVSTWVEEASAPVNQVIDPWLQEQHRCIGCRNYHGQFYGNEMLVCAMHPYGPDDDLEKCPDWESHWGL